MQLDGVDAIQQVLAEVSFVHQLTDVCIGGADEPHINGRSLRTSQTTDTTLFDGSQSNLACMGRKGYLSRPEKAYRRLPLPYVQLSLSKSVKALLVAEQLLNNCSGILLGLS